MNIRAALSPEWNVRCFPTGCPASGAAAEAWLGLRPPDHAWCVLVEGQADAPSVDGAVVEVQVGRDGRLALGGGLEPLLAMLPGLGPPGDEARRALSAAAQALLRPEPPLVMGIVNVTPDSFSDGGLWIDADRAVERGLELLDEGADVLDLGGESTRPGAGEVPPAEELRRILPVVMGLRRQTRALISLDTRKSEVARAGLEAGADWINDVSGLSFDPSIANLIAARPDARLILMHSRSRPADERYSTEWDAGGRPVYEDVVADSLRRLRGQAQVALERGVQPEQLWLDPGFGFGKTYEQNLELLRRLREYASAGLPLLVGTSRKSTVGKLIGDLPPDQRREGSAATAAWALAQGAAAVRVHDVKETARLATAVHALRAPAQDQIRAGESGGP